MRYFGPPEIIPAQVATAPEARSFLSKRMVFSPRLAQSLAVPTPALPPPTIATSKIPLLMSESLIDSHHAM